MRCAVASSGCTVPPTNAAVASASGVHAPAGGAPVRAGRATCCIWDGLYPVDVLSNCEEMPSQMQHVALPARTGAPPAGAWTLLDDATAVFVGGTVQPDDATAQRMGRDFRQIRAYGAFRVLVRR